MSDEQIPDILKRDRHIIAELETDLATVTAEREELKAERDRQYPTQEEMLDRIFALEAVVEAAQFLRAHQKKPGDWERLDNAITALDKGTVEGALAYLSSLPKNQPAEGGDQP